MKNNKGFSLVELIIVIAIMAILVGVMAPQLIKYIEKTNVSSDTQLADSVKTAITTAMMDPSVIQSATANIPGESGWSSCGNITSGAFKEAVDEILGFDVTTIDSHLKSTFAGGKANGVKFQIVNSTSVHVKVENSDSTGKKGKNQTAGSASNPIYVD